MAYLIEQLEPQESWTTDDTADVDAEGGNEWQIKLESPSTYHHPLKFRIGCRRSLLRLARSRTLHRIGCLLLVLAGIQDYLLHQDYMNALAAKTSPTILTHLSANDQRLLADPRWQLNFGDRDGVRRTVLENQARWKKLGSGYEGDTFTCNDTVIKVYKTTQSPLRNCVPGTTSKLAWPPEIPVSLLLGGLADTTRPHELTVPDNVHFVPVLDYFLLPTAEDDEQQSGEWHLVTPFLSSGTLNHLAKRLRHLEPSLTTDELDAHFRPSFHRILEALDIMHSQHNLCHDDVKLDNIFVTDYLSAPVEAPGHTSYSADATKDTHWLLGDLGNAREPSHGYHTSLLWSHDNGQHADCRVNDLRRLVKSYVLFLQAATKRSATHRDAFVQSFLTASAPWSRLYWYTMNRNYDTLENGVVAAARHIQNMSTTVFSPVDAEGNTSGGMHLNTVSDGPTRDDIQRLVRPVLSAAWFDNTWLGIDEKSRKVWSVGRELRSGLGLSEKWAKIFGTMGIMKIPARHC